uniref:Uncharacterized protein n=1 Tax=Chromera velia CCMP2878 TaxID=1169474 RepID=A0A0G4HG82_9ALVE|eukprot:Cvel_6739.t1-p1 / transcript=Cvel_6739.t1 / gene=Cvel_6739 / organism=Chromera_velia_CCMP2878 / gene_product=hypothetical protein / transcript_product=hypothetical protein / location=Cvel_scaffold337:48841-49095(+) / protein_length=85 / sequence_SO=supercontig / SO=protein_coding / is_pseudo=false
MWAEKKSVNVLQNSASITVTSTREHGQHRNRRGGNSPYRTEGGARALTEIEGGQKLSGTEIEGGQEPSGSTGTEEGTIRKGGGSA